MAHNPNKPWLTPLIVGCIWFTLPSSLMALPQVQNTGSGSAEILSPDSATMVIQASDKAIINYKSFNIGAKERVQFVQPSHKSSVLNRVRGSDPSAIMGKLESNGKVFLVNSQGVFFGPEATVNTGSLIVSTLNIADEDYLKDRFQFTLESGTQNASIINQGALSVSAEGTIALLAPHIHNTGVISAKAGKIVLASAEKITLDFTGDGLIGFALDGDLSTACIENGGEIQAPDGQVQLKIRAAAEVIKRTVNTDAFIEGEQIVERDGYIALVPSSKINAADIALAAPTIAITSAEVSATKDLTMIGTDEVRLRDSKGSPLQTVAYGNYHLESDKVDILAFYDEKTSLASGGNMHIVSENEMSTDAHFWAGGEFSFLKPSGGFGDFRSLYDPVITAATGLSSGVSFGAYTGVSLLVQTTGRIVSTGAITITALDGGLTGGGASFPADPALLQTKTSLIMRAGLPPGPNLPGTIDTTYVPNNPVPPDVTAGGATFTNTGALPGTDITLSGGAITLNSSPGPIGQVILAAPGGIFIAANTTIQAEGGTVAFTGNVNGDIPGRSLIVNAGPDQAGPTSSINVSGNIGDIQPLGSLTLSANQDVTIAGNVGLGGATTIASTSGNIFLLGTLNGSTVVPAIALTASTGGPGNISLGTVGNVAPLGALALTNERGAIEITGPVLLGGALTIASAGSITFDSTLDSSAVISPVTLNAGPNGGVTFTGAVGSLIPIGALTITTIGSAQGSGVLFEDALTFAGNSTINTSGGSVTFTGNVNADIPGRTLAITSGTGGINFASSVGAIQPLGAITLTNTGGIAFGDSVTLNGLMTLNAGPGAIAFSSTLNSSGIPSGLTINTTAGPGATFTGAVGGINPIGALTFTMGGANALFSDALTFGGNSTINSEGGAVVFTGNVNADIPGRTCTITSGVGPISFMNFIGNTQPLGALSCTTTVGNIGLGLADSSTITLGGASTLTTSGGNITIGSAGIAGTIDSDSTPRSLTIAIGGGGALTCNDIVGSVAPLGAISVTNASGFINFMNPVMMGGPMTLNAGTGLINFASTLDSTVPTNPLIINAGMGGPIVFTGAVGSVGPIGALIMTTANTPVSFQSALTFAGNSTLNTSGGNVIFVGDVNADIPGRSLTMDTGAGIILFQANLGNLQPLGALNLTNTIGTILFNTTLGNTVLGGNTSLITNSPVRFNSLVDADIPGRTLAITSGQGGINFISSVGSIQPLGAITLTNTGGIAFGASVALNGLMTLNTGPGAITFNTTLDSSGTPSNLSITTTTGLGTTFTGAVGGINPIGALTFTMGTAPTLFSNSLTFAGNSTINTSGGNVTFGTAVNGDIPGRTLAVTASAGGNISFAGSIGDTTPLGAVSLTTESGSIQIAGAVMLGGALTINSSGTLTFSGVLNSDAVARAVTINAGNGGLITFAADVGTTSPIGALTLTAGNLGIRFLNLLTFAGNSILNTNNGPITFNAFVNADVAGRTLTMNSGSGNILFQSNIGNRQPLGALNFSTTSGNMTFTGPVELGGTATLNTINGTIQFATSLNAALPTANLNINKSASFGNITFTGAVGSFGPLGTLTLLTEGAPITFSNFLSFSSPAAASTINTSTGLAAGGAVSFGAAGLKIGGALNITTQGGAITFNGPVDGDLAGRALTLASGTGTINFLTSIGSTQPLGALAFTTTSGPISLNSVSGSTTLGGNTSFTSNSGTISCIGNVSSVLPGITLSAATFGIGNITFATLGGNLLPLGALNLTTAAGNITFNEALILGGAATLTTQSGGISFGSTINSDPTPRALNITKTTAGITGITFADAVGALSPLGAMTIASGGAPVSFTNTLSYAGATSINTVSGGPLNFIGAVIAGGDTLLTTNGGAVTFSSTLNADAAAEHNLNIDSGVGAITFLGPIGSAQSFNTLTLNSASTLNLAGIGGATQGVATSTYVGNLKQPTTINFNGTTYNAANQSYSATGGFNFTSTSPSSILSRGTPIAFNTAPINLSGDFVVSSVSNSVSSASANGNIALTNLTNAGVTPRNITVNAGTGALTMNAIGTALGQFSTTALGDPGGPPGDLILNGPIFTANLTGYGDQVLLAAPITANTVALTATRSIVNAATANLISATGDAYFNAFYGTVGTVISPNGPILVNSGGTIWAGAPVLADFNGSGTVLPNPANIPCTIIFNGATTHPINPCAGSGSVGPPGPQGPSGPSGPQGLSGSPGPAGVCPGCPPQRHHKKHHVSTFLPQYFYLPGIYGFIFNLGDEYYFSPDLINPETLRHTYVPLYWMHS